MRVTTKRPRGLMFATDEVRKKVASMGGYARAEKLHRERRERLKKQEGEK